MNDLDLSKFEKLDSVFKQFPHIKQALLYKFNKYLDCTVAIIIDTLDKKVNKRVDKIQN